MDELKLDRAFVQIVESGNISAAARRLNTSVTSVARQLSRLEANLGVRLLNRTTRSQCLTEAGQVYYSRLVEVLSQVEEIKREVATYQEAVKGRLRVHMRASVGSQVIVPALPQFLEQYPDIVLDITLTDERADLVGQGVDIAIWRGGMDDSSLIARRLSAGRRVLCASPNYLDRNGYPAAPDDLVNHNCLVYVVKSYGKRWRFIKDGKTIEMPISGNLQTDSGAVLLAGVRSGVGLAVLQEAIVHDDIQRGVLVPVLTDFEVSPTDMDSALYAVYPAGRRVSPNTRAFVDFVAEMFRKRR